MSHESFAEFFGSVLESPEGESVRRELEGITDQRGFVERLVALGMASGYQFTTEQVVAVLQASAAAAARAIGKASGELDEEQLSGVVGGLLANVTIPTVNLQPSTFTWKSISLCDGSVFKF